MDSKNAKRIRDLCWQLGIQVESLVWENPGPALEMAGCSGGWILNGRPIGLSTHDALAHLQQCPESYRQQRKAYVNP